MMIRPGRYGFRARIRRLIHSEPLPWEAKAELFRLLARYGPYHAWEQYKIYTRGSNGQTTH